MASNSLPTVKEQTLIYKKVLDKARGKPVIFRSLDVGSDKLLPYWGKMEEENPAIGWRSIRITLDRRAILRKQMRAFIRAASGKELAAVTVQAHAAERDIEMRLTVDVERSHESAVIVAAVMLGSANQVYGLPLGQSAHGGGGMQLTEEGAEWHRPGQRKTEVAAQMAQVARGDSIGSLLLTMVGEAADAIGDIIGHQLLFGDILLAPKGCAPASHRPGQGDGMETVSVSLQQNLGGGGEPRATLRCRHQGHKHLGIATAGTEEEVDDIKLLRQCHLTHPGQNDFGEIATEDMVVKTAEILLIIVVFLLLAVHIVQTGIRLRELLLAGVLRGGLFCPWQGHAPPSLRRKQQDGASSGDLKGSHDEALTPIEMFHRRKRYGGG